jgi:phosphate transport system protein
MDMELEKIEQKLLKLGKLAEDALSKAVWALRQKDDNLAVEVINGMTLWTNWPIP